MANSGTLYVIGTDIGNKKYLSPAVKEALSDVGWVLTEHARRSTDILDYFNIKVKQITFNLKNEKTKTQEAVYRLSKGDNLGLLSDAGMPIVSDPGTELVDLCLKHKIKVKVISGTSSIVHALAYCGFPNVPFYFGGFLTPSKGRRSQGLDLKNMNIKDIYKVNKKNEMIPIIDEYINNILNERSTRKGLSIFFINGMHLDLILTKSQKFLPSNTQIAICSELTRAEEKINRGTSSELKNILQENQELKSGEHVIIFYINKI